jgi:hypothetical protein
MRVKHEDNERESESDDDERLGDGAYGTRSM